MAPAYHLHAHRPLPSDTDLEALFAETKSAIVAHHFTVRFENRLRQVRDLNVEAVGVVPDCRIVLERRLSASCVSGIATAT